ncbi:MAG: hypothetical protein ACM35G_13560 [Planctomycetaceae bacterium]
MDSPIAEVRDEDACSERLVAILHPDAREGPRGQSRDHPKVPRRHRAPALDYRGTACPRAFNASTETTSHKTHRRPSEILRILRGIARGTTTARLARELERHRQDLLQLRHRPQGPALRAVDPGPPDDATVEADARDRDAGGIGGPHRDPDDPPRRRGNRRPGHGRRAHDRPPVAGVVGRGSGGLRRRVGEPSDGPTPPAFVRRMTGPLVRVDTDEWAASDRRPEVGREPASVGPAAGEWARDGDGGGIREGPDNTLQGIWAGLRNDRRMSRGVNMVDLAQ